MVLPRWETSIPKNYYCNFNLKLNRDYLYTVQVDRFLSHSLSVNLFENIEFQVIGGPKNNEDKILVSNQDLRRTLHHEKSACVPTKMISNQQVLRSNNECIKFLNSETIEIYIRNLKESQQSTFQMFLIEQKEIK